MLHTRALIINERIFGPNHECAAPILKSLGSAKFKLELYAESRDMYDLAKDLFEKSSNFDEVWLINIRLGEVCYELGEYADSCDFYQCAICSIPKDNENKKVTKADLLQRIGNAHMASGNEAKAQKLFDEALVTFRTS